MIRSLKGRTFLAWCAFAIFLGAMVGFAHASSGGLQAAAVASGPGTVLNTNGQATAILTVNCAACSGGTTVNFEGTEDGTNYSPITGVLLGSNTTAQSTTTAGLTYWAFNVAGLQSIRARISGYSAGTVTVTGHAIPIGSNVSIGAAGVATSSNNADAVATSSNNSQGLAWLYAWNGTGWDRLQVDGSKFLKVNCAAGCLGGSFNNNADGVATSATNGQSAAWLYAWNGTGWDRLQVDGSKFLKVNCAAACPVTTFNNNADAVATSATNEQTAAWLYAWNGTGWDRLQVDGSKFLKVFANIGQVNGITTQTGTGIAGTGTQRTAAAQDSFNGNEFNASVIPTVQNAAYAAGQSLGGLQTISIGSTNGLSGILDLFRVESKGGSTVAMVVYVWQKNPTGTTCTDKTNFVVSQTDNQQLIAPPFLLTPALGVSAQDAHTYASASFNSNFVNGSSNTNLYVCVLANAAVTPASTTDLTYNIAGAKDAP